MATITNPWVSKVIEGGSAMYMTVTADFRIARIKVSTDIAWLQQVLNWPNNQKTVRLAAERRLRFLRKCGPALASSRLRVSNQEAQ